VAQQADGKVKEIKERVNKGIETSFQMLSDGLIAIGRRIGRWESKRDQGEGKQGYRDIISNVIRWANSYR